MPVSDVGWNTEEGLVRGEGRCKSIAWVGRVAAAARVNADGIMGQLCHHHGASGPGAKLGSCMTWRQSQNVSKSVASSLK